MNQCVVFIATEWLCPSSWSYFIQRFTLCGFECKLLSLPTSSADRGKRGMFRQHPEANRISSLKDAVEFFSREIGAYPSPPILIGHCVGGLLVQVLLSRGLGSLGVAICPIPTSPILRRWGALRRHAQFNRANLTFRRVRSLTLRQLVASVPFAEDHRAPLLLISGGSDRLSPPFIVEHMFRRYRNSTADTCYKNFPKRTHDLINDKEGEEVADFIIQWIRGQTFAPV